MKHPCRCKANGHRQTLNRHPDDYKIPPRCRQCGSRQWRVDKYRMNNPDKCRGAPVCKSDCMAPIYGHSGPHRMNTKGCKHYDDWLLDKVVAGAAVGLTLDEEPGF